MDAQLFTVDEEPHSVMSEVQIMQQTDVNAVKL
jgi:hypothetical protein